MRWLANTLGINTLTACVYSLCHLLFCRDCTTPSHHALATAGVVALRAAPRATTSSSPWRLDAPTGCTNDSCGMHSLMLWCVTGDFSACLASFWGCGVNVRVCTCMCMHVLCICEYRCACMCLNAYDCVYSCMHTNSTSMYDFE